MGEIIRAACLAGIVAPIMTWTCAEAFRGVAGKSVDAERHARWSVVLALGAIFLQVRLIERLRFYLHARAKGCLSPAYYPHKDPVLGLDLVVSVVRAFRSNTIILNLQRRFETVGSTYWSIAFSKWVLTTNDPENVKVILSAIDDFPIAGPRLDAVLPLLGPKSIFSSNGREWHDARTMLRPSFVRDQIADLDCFGRHVGDLLRAIPRDGSTFDIQKLFLDMTMDSSTDFMLGYSTDLLTEPLPGARRFIQAFEYVAVTSARRGVAGTSILPSRELDHEIKIIRDFIRTYMDKASEDGKTRQRERKYVFFDELIKSGASQEFVLDQILSIIIAGRDTTAGALANTLYFLARSPEVVKKARQEVMELNEPHPTWEQLKGMKYLANIIKEALRLFPPIAINSRTTSKEVILPRGGGPDRKSPILIPKGTPCRWSSYCLHRREDLYGPDADDFRPERWDTLRPGWEYIPFSGGPRICVGQQFALTQMTYTLYRILQKFVSIESRDPEPMLIKTATTSLLANGCLISMEPV